MLDPALACFTLIAIVASLALSGALTGSLARLWPAAGDRGGGAPAGLGQWIEAFGVGAALWMLLLFALAAAQLLRPGLLLGLALLLPAVALLRVVGSRRNRRTSASAPETRRRPALRPPLAALGALAAGAAVAATLAALVVRALLPIVSWDADVYHLTLPRLFLEHGGFFRVPFSLYSNWPLGVDLLYGLALALRDHVPAKLLHFAFGTLTTLLACRLAGPARGAGPLAACLFLANPVVLGEMPIAYVDLAFAFFLTLGFATLDEALDAIRERGHSPRTNGLVLVAGVCSGALCATKITGFLGALCLALVLVIGLAARRGVASRAADAGALARFALPSLALLLPWPIKTWWLTGNPVYPFLYSRFGGPEWSERLGEQFAAWQRAIGMGREPLDYLLLPVRVILSGGGGYARFDGEIAAAWIVLVPLALLRARADRRVRRALGLSGVYFVLWALGSQQMRFLVPILPLLAVAAARAITASCAWLAARLPRPSSAPARESALLLVAGIGAAALLSSAAFPYLAFAVRAAPRLATDYAGAREAAIHPAHRYVSDRLPEDARILMINHNRGYFVRRPFLADSTFEASQIAALFRHDDKAAAVSRLRGLGITHVVLQADIELVRGYPPGLVEVLSDPDLARTVYASPDPRIAILELQILELQDPSRARPAPLSPPASD